ncbi:MAG: Hpt domain-containing protein [Lachnospiraceae bacterium]|nr:Hpt domain-containing protein [Lachnospiraceae bacterium]
MDINIKDELVKKGVDYGGALHRFLDMEDMYINFLKTYAEDNSFEEIRTSIADRDAESAFVAAHNMKGLAINLGLNVVAGVTTQLAEQLRDKAYDELDIEKVNALIENLSEVNKEYVDLIREL